MKKESESRRQLLSAFRRADALASAIESGSTGLGIPDVYVAHGGKAWWLECKLGEIKDGTLRVSFRPGQEAWLYKNEEQGNGSFLMIYCNEDKTFYFFKGDKIRDRYSYPVTEYCYKTERLSGSVLLSWMHAQ